MTISEHFANRGDRSNSTNRQSTATAGPGQPDDQSPPALADSVPAWDLLPPHSVMVRRSRDA